LIRREAAGWLYVRISGVLLLVLVLGHMFLMHILIGVNQIDFALISARYAGLGWRAYDLGMLLLAMPHAALGLRGLAFDHLKTGARRPLLGAGYAVCLLVTLLGVWVIVTFPQPV
jgi:succinate dehydrogenase / fumarate reductase membrane anchor subunit